MWRGRGPRIQDEELEIVRDGEAVPATFYRPEGADSPLPGWVVMHGVTRPGRNHPMLLRFVRALAGSGMAVLVPEIPEWRALHLAPERALAMLRASVSYLPTRSDIRPGRVGLMGFSFGVPQVLVAAGEPSLNGTIRCVAGFGGYADLERAVRFLFRGSHELDGKVLFGDPDPYGRWIVGGNYLTLVPGFESANDVAHALLRLAREAGDQQVGSWEAHFDALKDQLAAEVDPSRRPLFRAFAPVAGELPDPQISDVLAHGIAEAARRSSPLFDPTLYLDRIQVPVRLIHGREDRLIPFTESLRLERRFPRTADVRVYLTGLFAHSQRENRRQPLHELREQVRFIRILSDLLSLV